MNEDLQYLKLLSIFHYVVGGLAALSSFIPVIYVVIGVLAVCIPGSFEGEGEAMPLFVGWIFIIIGRFTCASDLPLERIASARARVPVHAGLLRRMALASSAQTNAL